MKLLTGVLILATAFFACGAGTSLAGPFYLQAHGGFFLFNPDDVNDVLDRFNEEAGGPFLDRIGTGLDVGLSAGRSLTAELGLGLGYARLSGNSGFSQDGYLVEYDLPADLYEIFLDYLPSSSQKVRVGAGATLGMIRSAATLRVTDPADGDQRNAFAGEGFLFAGYAIVETAVSLDWSLFGRGGFRHAIISDLEVNGETVYNADSLDDKLRFNYSGLFLRVGVKFQP